MAMPVFGPGRVELGFPRPVQGMMQGDLMFRAGTRPAMEKILQGGSWWLPVARPD